VKKVTPNKQTPVSSPASRKVLKLSQVVVANNNRSAKKKPFVVTVMKENLIKETKIIPKKG